MLVLHAFFDLTKVGDFFGCAKFLNKNLFFLFLNICRYNNIL